MRGRTLLGLALVASAAACSSDPAGSDLTNDGGAIPSVDAGGDPNPVTPDSGGGSDAGNVDSGKPGDTTAPLAVSDLAATVLGHTSVGLAWTAPSDPPGGNVSSYDIRRSKANIANDAEFAAATPVTTTMGAPKPAGGAESITVTGLDPETTYYFAVRAKDAAGNVGPISNIASATTKARAALLLSEVAMANATGEDFIELVVTKAGNLKDVVVRQAQSPNVLHTFADVDVALGARIVVHLTGAAGTNTPSDVYSTADNLVGTDNVISVVDGTAVVDAVAYSDRDGDASAASMTAFASAKTASAWAFTATPVDAANDCDTQREAVAVSTTLGNGQCGRFATGIAAGKSINRNGTTDTNTKEDWYVAAQTPGAANAAVPAPIGSAVATSATTVSLRFDQEIDPAAVALGAFSATGVTISAVTLVEPAIVTLTTSTQNGPHAIGVSSSLKTVYGASVPNTFRFCGYEPLGGFLALTEVSPTIPNADLLELQATRAGLVGHLSVRANPQSAADAGGLVANMPAGLCVAFGDVVVVHVQPAAAPAMPNEVLSKNEVTTEASYYAGAWDVRGGSTGLPSSDAVIAVRDLTADAYVDALAYTDANGTPTAAFSTSLAFVQSLSLWTAAPSDESVAASHVGVDDTTGTSLRRSSPTAARNAASWSVGASSFGN